MNEAIQKEPKKKDKYVLGREAASEQFELLEEYYDIDEDDMEDDLGDEEEDEISESGKAGYRMAKKRLLRALRKGQIEIKDENDTLRVIQTLAKPPKELGGKNVIIYNEITGQAKIPMKKHKDNNLYGKIYAFLSGLSGQEELIFRNLKGADLSIAESLGAVFLRV